MVHRRSYASDLSDREWQILEPLLPIEKPGGRHRADPMREIINAIQYLLRNGCAWRALPHDLPHWETAYHYFRQWKPGWNVDRDSRSSARRSQKKDGSGNCAECRHH